MNLLILSSTLTVVGDILIAIVILSVHQHIMKERQIDADVIQSMSHERLLVVLGISFIVVGYLIELAVRLNMV